MIFLVSRGRDTLIYNCVAKNSVQFPEKDASKLANEFFHVYLIKAVESNWTITYNIVVMLVKYLFWKVSIK